MRRSDPSAPGKVADRSDLEQVRGAGDGALVAARQAPPAPELGDRVLDLVERPERRERAPARWRRLDVEPAMAVPAAQLGEDRLGSVTRGRRTRASMLSL